MGGSTGMKIKKATAVLLITALCFVLAACGQSSQNIQSTQNVQSSQDTQSSQIANPWRICTEEQTHEICPNSFKAPDGAENVMWSILDSAADNSGVPGPLVQMSFDLDGNHYTAREQITGETKAEIAGMYYDWTVQNDIVLSNWGNAAGKYCRYIGENEYADLCTWHDIDTSYSLSITASDLDGFDLHAVAEAMCAEVRQAVPYDTAAYEAAAQTVREEFVRVIQDGIDAFDEAAHPELPWYTAALTRFPENKYFDGYADFDGNGIPEMVIGTGRDTSMPLTPIAVYAFDGQKMHYLCKEHPLGERAYLSRGDGLFVVHGSGGAASGILVLYRIGEDGWSTEIVDVIDYEYTDADHVTYTSEYGRISPEELVSRGLPDSSGLDVAFEWHCFYPASIPGTWQTASMAFEDDGSMSPEYHVRFTDSEIQYGHMKDGTFVLDHSDPITLFEETSEGKYKVQASASNGVQYTYRTSASDNSVLEYYETWDEADFPEKYSGGSSLSRST